MPKAIEFPSTPARHLPPLALVASSGKPARAVPSPTPAAILAGLGAIASATTVPPADAELVRLAAQLVSLETQADVLRGEVARHEGFPEAHGISSRRLKAVVRQIEDLRDRAAAIQAVTRDGLVAKAQIIEAHWGGPMEPTETVAWSLVCDLLGR